MRLRRQVTATAHETFAPIVASAWLGLSAGLFEVALITVKRLGMGAFMRIDPQNVWMAPLAYGLVFSMIAALATITLRGAPRTAFRLSVATSLFLGSLGSLFLIYWLHRGAAAVLSAGIAIQGSGWVLRREARFLSFVRATLTFVFGLVIAIGIGLNVASAVSERRSEAAVGAGPLPAAGDPNVLFIVWDTVRAADLSLYGYGRRTTPALERLGQRGVVFDHALSPAPWTLPSHASMFTGLPADRLAASWEQPLEEGPATLAELFRDNGYRTAGFVANVRYAGRSAGINRGFVRFRDYPIFSFGDFFASTKLVREMLDRGAWRRVLRIRDEPGRRSANQVNAEFLDWVGDRSSRPFFAFLNYYDAHEPHLPPKPYDTAFGPLLPGRWPLLADGTWLTPVELRAEVDAYDGAIAYLDNRLQLLLAELDRRHILQDTLVVVTSDHGQQFGENGLLLHGNSLYNTALHVPLVVSLPGRVPEGRRITPWMTTTNLAATIQHIAGISPGSPMPGESMESQWSPNDVDRPARPVVASVRRSRGLPTWYPVSRGQLKTVIDKTLKFITNSDGTQQLYDLSVDPGEHHDLWREAPTALKLHLRAAAATP